MNMKVISVIHDEFKTIAGSYAILLVLMGGIFVYGLLYNYMYADRKSTRLNSSH